MKKIQMLSWARNCSVVRKNLRVGVEVVVVSASDLSLLPLLHLD
jgi:hypothetical protein